MNRVRTNPRVKRSRWLVVFFLAVSTIFALTALGCSFGRAKNALYIYMCGSTLETKAGAGSKNIDELLEAEVPAGTEVVIQTGGAATWRGHDIPSDSLNRYVVQAGELRLVETLDDASMGDAETLQDFLSWCESTYPAEEEALVLWDHGEGTNLSFCYDENHNMDPLTAEEVESAFKGANAHFTLIGLDLCLLASIDMANLFAPYASYLVASQDIEPAGGWDYKALVESLGSDKSALETAHDICDSYLAKCEETGKDSFTTLSVIDLSQLAQVQVAFEDFAADLTSTAEAKDGSFSVASASGRAMAFGANSPSEGYSNMIDLWGFANTIAERTDLASAKALCTALEELVPYSVTGAQREGAKGVSLYYPSHYDAQKLEDYLAVCESEHYKAYLNAVYGEIPEKTVDFLNRGSVADDGSFQIQLTPESKPYLRSVDFYLLEPKGEDPSHPTLVNQLGSDSDVTYDWDTLTFNSNFRGMWPALNGVPLNSTFIGSAGETLLFTAPVRVNGERTNLRFSYVFDEDSEDGEGRYEIIGLFDGLDEYELAPKGMRSLEPGDEVVVLTRTQEGKSQDSELEEGEKLTVGKEGATVADTPLQEHYYRYLFVVRDIFGNIFTSEPALFEMQVTPKQLMSSEVIDRTYAADVVSIGGSSISIDKNSMY